MDKRSSLAPSTAESIQSESEISTDTSILNDSHLSEVEYLKSQNNRLKLENEIYKVRVKQLVEDLKKQKLENIHNQVVAETEEEFISNKLLRKIQYLRNKIDEITSFYEEEELHLNNSLQRKMARANDKRTKYMDVKNHHQVKSLKNKIERLEFTVKSMEEQLNQSKCEKVELTNLLETEQERLINKLFQRINHLKNTTNNFKDELKLTVSKSIESIELDHIKSMNFDELVLFVQKLRNNLKNIQDDLSKLQPDESFALVSKCDPSNVDLWLNKDPQSENRSLTEAVQDFKIN